jgi:hypothetical protein
MEKISFQGVAVAGEETALQAILTDYQSKAQGKTVAMKMNADGRITALELEGLEKTDKRSGLILDTVQMLMRRLFAPLDLQLPKNGDAGGKPWRQKGSPMALELLTRFGTAGGSRIEHRVGSTSGQSISISSTGRGMVSPGDSLEAGTGAMMKIQTTGKGYFSPALGRVIWREIHTEAKYTVSSHSSGSGRRDYEYKGMAAQVLADGTQSDPTQLSSP